VTCGNNGLCRPNPPPVVAPTISLQEFYVNEPQICTDEPDGGRVCQTGSSNGPYMQINGERFSSGGEVTIEVRRYHGANRQILDRVVYRTSMRGPVWMKRPPGSIGYCHGPIFGNEKPGVVQAYDVKTQRYSNKINVVLGCRSID
jgi:hypothetical protein